MVFDMNQMPPILQPHRMPISVTRAICHIEMQTVQKCRNKSLVKAHLSGGMQECHSAQRTYKECVSYMSRVRKEVKNAVDHPLRPTSALAQRTIYIYTFISTYRCDNYDKHFSFKFLLPLVCILSRFAKLFYIKNQEKYLRNDIYIQIFACI